MTRTDELFSMTGRTLIQLADKLGVKVVCNKTRTQLKEKKENVVNRILEAEKQIADVKVEKQIEKAVEVKVEEAIASDGTEYTQVMKEIQQDAENEIKADKKVKADKLKKSSVKSEDIEKLSKYVFKCIKELGIEAIGCKSENGRYTLKYNSSRLCELCVKSKCVGLYVKSSVCDITELDNVSMVNLTFDARVRFNQWTESSANLIKELLVTCRDYQLNKKSKNSNKEEK